MGGKVLDYEAKTIRNAGINAGRLEQLIDLVKLNLLSVKDAARQAQLSEKDFLRKMNSYGA